MFEVQDNAIDASAGKLVQEVEHEAAAGSEPEMNWPRRLGRFVSQINIQRLHEGA